jgi:hypothetical protein
MDKKEHITARTLDYFVAAPEALSAEERENIQAHISTCKLCSDHLNAVKSFYRELEERLAQPPTPRDEELAEKLLQPQKPRLLPSDALIRTYAEIFPERKSSLIRRVIGYVQLHPFRSTGFATALAAALVLAFFALQPKRETNPAYHKVLHQVLYVYNKYGEVLWAKSARGLQDDSSKYNPLVDEVGSPSFVRVFDIDGDGRNELLVTLEPARAAGLLKPYDFAPDTLYCFNSDGSLRWKHGMSGGMRFGAVDFSKNPHWHIYKFLPVRRSSRERVQLFVFANILPSWASKLFELDPQTGKELQSYWHAGDMRSAVEADVDGDGTKELVVGGVNNHLRGAAIAVFDPRSVQGAGPTIPEMVPTEAGKGTEKYYLLLPRSSLGIALGTRTPYNSVKEIRVSTEGRVVIQTDETTDADYNAGLVYGFGDNMRINYVVANDPFEVNFEKARKQGLIKDELNAAYYENLRKSVRYWDGERFVNEPTMNRYYLSRANLP